jgi:Zn-dependent protease with chaperone function
MSAQVPSKPMRIAALTAVLGIILFVADHFLGGHSTKTLGALLAAAAAIFFIGETYFWKAVEKLTELPHSDALSASEAADLAHEVKALKSRLTERWLILLVLKAIAGMCAAWLLNQQNPNPNQRIVWLVGVGALTVSLPMALTFLRNWQQADEIKSQQLLRARQKKELKEAIKELSTPPASPLGADKILAGYTKVVRGAKPKNGSA